jgi:serine/threonine-protein kinase
MKAPAAPRAPPSVGRYVLHGEIASGGMATVYFGRLQGAAGFTRSVAIKRLHPQFAKDPDFVAMFVDEARLAARIAHPNVVSTLDVVSYADELLLVMEYVHGASLSRLTKVLAQRGERMPPRIVASIVCGVLHGLHAAHEAKGEGGLPLGIVHRDVSPQNVMVGTDGIARVLDFGVAKAAGRWQSTQRGQLKGKLAYMAPEQIATHDVTRKSDVYAAAVILWETLTGHRLFRADNEARLMALVLAGRVEPPSAVAPGSPAGFDRVVLRGLHRDAEKRFATAREMATELERVVGAAPPTEVGEWVEYIASEELRERTHRIEEIERITPTPPLSKTTPAEAHDQKSLVHLGMARSHAHNPAASWRYVGVVGAAVAGCALALGLMTIRARHTVRLADAEAPALEAPNPPSAPSHDVGIVPPAWNSPPAPEPPASSSPAPNATVNAPARRNVARPVRAPRAASTAATARPDCNPPYTADGNGHIHFKPACVD